MGRFKVILVDRHIVIWPAFSPDMLSAKATKAIDDARSDGEGLAISDISLLELATLVSKRRVHLILSRCPGVMVCSPPGPADHDKS